MLLNYKTPNKKNIQKDINRGQNWSLQVSQARPAVERWFNL